MSIKTTDPDSEAVTCPFCGETDYDRKGLKMHLELGWCEVYGKIETRHHD